MRSKKESPERELWARAVKKSADYFNP